MKHIKHFEDIKEIEFENFLDSFEDDVTHLGNFFEDSFSIREDNKELRNFAKKYHLINKKMIKKETDLMIDFSRSKNKYADLTWELRYDKNGNKIHNELTFELKIALFFGFLKYFKEWFELKDDELTSKLKDRFEISKYNL